MHIGPERGPLQPRARLILFGIILLGFGLRLLWVLWLHPPGKYIYSDMFAYVDRARHVLAGRYDQNDWMYPPVPGMFLALPMLLVPNHWEVAGGVMQAVLSTFEIWFVFLGARRWFGTNVALASALCFALNYLAIDFTGLFMAENYLTLGLTLSFALFDPEDPVKCGFAALAVALGALAKPQAILVGPCWFAYLVLRRRFAAAAALTLGASALVLPAAYAASRASGHPVMLSSMGGIVMVQAWCPIKDVSASGPGWTMLFGMPIVGERANRGEPEGTWGRAHYDVPFTNSSFYMHEGIKCIKRYPKFALKTFFRTQLDNFAGPPWSVEGPFPDAYTEYRTSVMAFNLFFAWIVAPLGFWAMWRLRRDTGIIPAIFMPVLGCLAIAALMHGEPRLRSPYDFYWYTAACAGIASLIAARLSRRTPSSGPTDAAPPDPSATAA